MGMKMKLTGIRGSLRELIEDGTCEMQQELIIALNKRLRDVDIARLKHYIAEQREFAVRDAIREYRKTHPGGTAKLQT